MNVTPRKDVFEPAFFSIAENRFLLANLGKPAIIAMDGRLPEGVLPAAVEPVLTRVEQLEHLASSRNKPWAGLAKLKDAIARYLNWMERSAAAKERGAPGAPSMYAWGVKGKPQQFAIGADSGYVQHEMISRHERKPFAVHLLESEAAPLFEDTLFGGTGAPADVAHQTTDEVRLRVTGNAGAYSCSICAKAFDFKTDNNRQAQMAWANINKHMRQTKSDVNRHRILGSRLDKASIDGNATRE
jgi:hypothetical protein